jgi:hypothetical protein
MGAMILIGRFRHGTKRVKFLVELGGRHNIIAHVVSDMPDGFVCFHAS